MKKTNEIIIYTTPGGRIWFIEAESVSEIIVTDGHRKYKCHLGPTQAMLHIDGEIVDVLGLKKPAIYEGWIISAFCPDERTMEEIKKKATKRRR